MLSLSQHLRIFHEGGFPQIPGRTRNDLFFGGQPNGFLYYNRQAKKFVDKGKSFKGNKKA